jgi:hypothetical protein
MVTMRVRIGRRQLDMLRSGSRNLRIHELNGKAPAPGKG